MNYALITEQSFLNRYNTISDELRELLDAEQTRKTVANISKDHYLTPEKAIILEQLVGLVLLGFLAPRNIADEIGSRLYLNHEHARVLANEVQTRIFEPVQESIENTYNPLEEYEGEQEEADKSHERIPIAEGMDDSFPISVSIKEGDPLVLHEEPSFFTAARSEPKRKSIPFNIFSTSPESSDARPAVKARVETPEERVWPLERKPAREEKKIVHYSELRSSLNQVPGEEGSLINMEALEKKRIEEHIGEVGTTEPQKKEDEKKSGWMSNLFPKRMSGVPTPVKTPIVSASEGKMPSESISISFSTEPAPVPIVVPSAPSHEPQTPNGSGVAGPEIEGNLINLK